MTDGYCCYSRFYAATAVEYTTAATVICCYYSRLYCSYSSRIYCTVEYTATTAVDYTAATAKYIATVHSAATVGSTALRVLLLQ